MRAYLGPWSLVVWTLFVWGTRVRNILNDDDLAGSELVWRMGLAASLTAFALVGAASLATHSGIRWAIGALAALSSLVWVMRGIDIAFGDHSAAFIAVHVALAAITIGLSWWAWNSVSSVAPVEKKQTPA